MLAKAKPAVGIPEGQQQLQEPSSVALIIAWAMRPSTAPNKMPPRASCRNRPATLVKVGSDTAKGHGEDGGEITRPTRR